MHFNFSPNGTSLQVVTLKKNQTDADISGYHPVLIYNARYINSEWRLVSIIDLVHPENTQHNINLPFPFSQ